MKRIKTYLKFNENLYIDELLDKINNNGIESLSTIEKEHLDAYSRGEEIEEINGAEYMFNGIFIFEYHYKKYSKDGEIYYGEFRTEGFYSEDEIIFKGYIIKYYGGDIDYNFQTEDISDLSGYLHGLENEFDIFLRETVDDINTIS